MCLLTNPPAPWCKTRPLSCLSRRRTFCSSIHRTDQGRRDVVCGSDRRPHQTSAIGARMKPVALLFLFLLSCCTSSAIERSLGRNMDWQRHSREVQEWFIHQWREQGFAVGKVRADFLKYLIEELDYVGEPFKKPQLEIRPYDLAIVMLEWDKGGFGMVRYRTA